MTVEPRSLYSRHRFKVATDGERFTLRAPLVFSIAPHPLMLIKSPPT
jgi:hypothetical protein